MLPLIALLATAGAEPAWFHPGAGPEIAVIGADSTIGGVPVRLTGHLLAGVDDPAPLALLPDVAGVERLGGPGRVVRVRVAPGVDELALSRTLRDRPDVRWCHPDLAFRPVLHALPDDPFVADQWHLENSGQTGWTPDVDVDATVAWTASTGAGALVAIIDTGVDLDHPDLRVTSGWDYVGGDADSSPDLEYDGGPHGTAAAGLAAAAGNNALGVAGVAYDADVYAIRFIGGATTLGDLYDAFVEAVDAGAWVLSNSWGFGETCSSFPTYLSIQEAIDYAEVEGRGGLGTVVVASAGNSNCDFSGDGFQAHPSVVSVGAINGDDERESYSSYGDLLDIAAPSGGVLTTDITGDDGYGSWDSDPDYYGYFSGTSASAPIVSGVLALMFSANPRLTAEEARAVLCETAVRVDLEGGEYDADGWSPWYGCGRVDAGAAVLAVADGPPTAPTPWAPGATALADRVLLQWEPAVDPDADPLAYEVEWWVDDDAPTLVAALRETVLEITDQVSVGDRVSWQVRAVDAWGPGPASEARSFTVEAVPTAPEPAGCATGPGAGSPLLAAISLLLRRRGSRRKPRRAPGKGA